jgi:hypothetical protein
LDLLDQRANVARSSSVSTNSALAFLFAPYPKSRLI